MPGAEVALDQVAEHLSESVLQPYGAKAAKTACAKIAVARVEQLAEADAIIFGTPTRFGNGRADGQFPGSNWLA